MQISKKIFGMLIVSILYVSMDSSAQKTNSEKDDRLSGAQLTEPENIITHDGRYRILSFKEQLPSVDPDIIDNGAKNGRIKHYQKASDLKKILYTFIEEDEVDAWLSEAGVNFYWLKESQPIVAVTSGFGKEIEKNAREKHLSNMSEVGNKTDVFIIWVHLTYTLKNGVRPKEVVDFDEDVDHKAIVDVSIKYLYPSNYTEQLRKAIVD